MGVDRRDRYGCGITDENLGRIFEPFFTKEVGRRPALRRFTVSAPTGGYLGVESVVGQERPYDLLPTARRRRLESDAKM